MQYRNAFGQAFGLESWIAGAVFLAILLTMAGAVLFSWLRRRHRSESSQLSEHNPLELAYLAVVAGLAAFLITTSLRLNDRETADPPQPVLLVRVTAFQWCWSFQYAGQPVTITGRCQGATSPTLVLPSHRPVRIEVTSADVIHGFWISYLRWKIYAYPGHVNSFTVTLNQNGRWVGRCSELCGLYHYLMDFYLQAVPPAQFDRWLQAHGGHPNAVSLR